MSFLVCQSSSTLKARETKSSIETLINTNNTFRTAQVCARTPIDASVCLFNSISPPSDIPKELRWKKQQNLMNFARTANNNNNSVHRSFHQFLHHHQHPQHRRHRPRQSRQRRRRLMWWSINRRSNNWFRKVYVNYSIRHLLDKFVSLTKVLLMSSGFACFYDSVFELFFTFPLLS